MVAESRTLYPDEVQVSVQPGKGEHGYYRRGDNGWIITGPVWQSFRNDFAYKGFTYLPQYGAAPLDMPGNKTTRDVNGRLFSMVEEPFRLIFQKGGVHEFPVSQIIAYRWHVQPPYREVKFPQLEGVEITDLFCPECEKGIFSSTNEQEAVEMLRVHLTTTTNPAHSYRPEDLRALGTELSIDFFAPRRRRNNRDRTVEEPPELESEDLTTNTEYGCQACGAVFPTRGERMRHGKECPAKTGAGA